MAARFVVIALTVGAVVSAFGCTHEPTAPAPWPAVADSLFGADATLWSVVDTLGGGLARPAVDADRVYFGRGELTSQSEIIARDRATGALRWHQPFTSAQNAVTAATERGFGAFRIP